MKEKEYLLENLALLLDSGMNVLPALQSIKEETRSRSLKKIIDKMMVDIDSGSSLWFSFEKSKLFPAYVISLVRIGEESGRLPENLQIIATQQKKQRELTSRLKSAMIYPSIVLSLTLMLGIGISWFVLPNLSKVFVSLNLELPITTQILIGIGNFLSKYGFIAVPSFIVVMFLAGFILFVNRSTRQWGEELMFRVPGIRGLIKEVELARFGYILGNMLDSGIIIIDAVDSMRDAITLKSYKQLYTYLADSIENGNSFQKSFKGYKHIDRLMPPHIQQMVIAGERSGRLPKTLIKIGETYETKTDNTTKNLEVILEPVLLVVMGLGVLFVALGIVVPIYSLVGGLNNSTTGTGGSGIKAELQIGLPLRQTIEVISEAK